MRRLALTLLPLVLLGPGCMITDSVWDWAEKPERIEGASAAEITTWSRGQGEAFLIRVRYTDGGERLVTVREDLDAPAGLLRESLRGYDPRRSAERVLLAVERGLVSRAFATDPAFAWLAREPAFQDASVAPLVTPTFALGPIERRMRELHLSGADGRPVSVELLQPHDEVEDQPGHTVLAVLATPFTFTLDVATFPFQAVYYAVVIAAASSGVAH